MKHLIRPALFALACAALLPLSAEAHRSWLMPSSGQVDGKNLYITVDGATSDNLFQADSFPLKLDGLTVTAPDGSTVTPENPYTGKFKSSFDLKLPVDGTYRIAVVSDAVSGRYTLNGETKRFRGAAADLATLVPAGATDVVTSHMMSRVETYASANKPSDAALKPTGKGLEIVPLSNPADYVAGDKASFRALLDGKPLAGLTVEVIPGGVRYRGALKDTDVTTAADGTFSVTWAMGQMYWIGASYPARPAGGEGGEDHGGGKGGQQGQGGQGQARGDNGPGGDRGPGEGRGQGGPGGLGGGFGGGFGGDGPSQRYSYTGTFEVMPF